MVHKPVHALSVVAAVFATIAVVGVAIVVTRGISPPGRHAQPPAKHEQGRAPAIEFASALAPAHAVYKYSVIEGGARTRDELAAAIQSDPVVANHYRSIRTGQVRAEIVDADRAVYVSYRRGDQIYWTSHKVMLRKGETILTDGSTQVRSRCGNCISLDPMLPTAEDEPDTVELDALVPGPVLAEAGGSAPSLALADVIAAGLIDGLPGTMNSFDATAAHIGGAFVGSPAVPGAFDSGSGGPGAIPNNPGGPEIPRLSVPPPVVNVPFPNDVPGGVPAPPNQPPVLVILPPPFGPPGDVPGIITPNNLPPDVPPAPVPEPGTLLLVGAGGVRALLQRRRSRKA